MGLSEPWLLKRYKHTLSCIAGKDKQNKTQTLKIVFSDLAQEDTNTTTELIFTLLTMWLTIFSSKKGFFSFRIKIKI